MGERETIYTRTVYALVFTLTALSTDSVFSFIKYDRLNRMHEMSMSNGKSSICLDFNKFLTIISHEPCPNEMLIIDLFECQNFNWIRFFIWFIKTSNAAMHNIWYTQVLWCIVFHIIEQSSLLLFHSCSFYTQRQTRTHTLIRERKFILSIAFCRHDLSTILSEMEIIIWVKCSLSMVRMLLSLY